ncbi:MAG: hypothetical protein IOD05_14520 [Rhodobacter sp.]|nr:hypothetical protein [Rhodobacter sp.]
MISFTDAHLREETGIGQFLLASLLSFALYLPTSSNAMADTQLNCIFSTTCLETHACSRRKTDLVIRVTYSDDGGIIDTPGQDFPISRVQDGGYGAISFLSEHVNGSTMFLTVFPNWQARLSSHFYFPEAFSMTDLGSCE